ncbi:MAG TPA: hypothetical protein VIJ65_08405 [Acidobacteriaceae bacterium]
MSTASDAFNLLKRIFLINEEMTRISANLDRIADLVAEQDRRLIRLETMVELSGRRSRLILPGE